MRNQSNTSEQFVPALKNETVPLFFNEYRNKSTGSFFGKALTKEKFPHVFGSLLATLVEMTRGQKDFSFQIHISGRADHNSLQVQIVEPENAETESICLDSLSKEEERVYFMQQFHQAIKANLKKENFKIKDLCTILATNHVSLNNRVKEITGYTTAKYIRNYRLSLAKHLLETTSLSTTEIAWKVGVAEASNFSNMFKKRYGKGPRAWRNELI